MLPKIYEMRFISKIDILYSNFDKINFNLNLIYQGFETLFFLYSKIFQQQKEEKIKSIPFTQFRRT